MKNLNTIHRRFQKLSIAMLTLGLALVHEYAQSQPALGVGTHFAQARTDEQQFLNWMAKTPFTTFRDEIYWNDVETAPKQFKPSKRAQNTLQVINDAVAAGIDPLVVLDYGNQFYDGGSQPSTDEGRAAFGKYVEWVVQATKGKVNKFEIWNEWNIGAGKKPTARNGSAEDYVKLTQVAAAAIRKANPNATIIGGAITDDTFDWAWLRETIRYGLLNQVDGVSLHLYNHSIPIYRGGAREMIGRIGRAHAIIQAAAPAKNIPIYVTEIGWPNNVGQFGISLTDAATQATIFLLEANALDYLKGFWFYEFKNSGRNINEREDNFGLLDSDDQPKPMACAMTSLGQRLKGAKLTATKNQGASRIMLYRLADGSQLLATWTPWVKPTQMTQALDLPGKNLDFKPLDLGCFKPANATPARMRSAGIKMDQGYSPSLYVIPKDAVIDLSSSAPSRQE